MRKLHAKSRMRLAHQHEIAVDQADGQRSGRAAVQWDDDAPDQLRFVPATVVEREARAFIHRNDRAAVDTIARRRIA